METMMEGGRQGFQSGASHALCYFSFSYDWCSSIINVLHIALFHFMWIGLILQSLCHPVVMQRSSKASPKEATD